MTDFLLTTMEIMADTPQMCEILYLAFEIKKKKKKTRREEVPGWLMPDRRRRITPQNLLRRCPWKFHSHVGCWTNPKTTPPAEHIAGRTKLGSINTGEGATRGVGSCTASPTPSLHVHSFQTSM